MAYFGKEFVHERQENIEGFVNSLNGGKLDERVKQAMIAHKPTFKVVKAGDGYTFYTTRADGTPVEVNFKPGVEFEEVVGGTNANSVVNVKGDVFTQTMKFPEGSVTIERRFSDNELVATYTTSEWNGKAVRYFKA